MLGCAQQEIEAHLRGVTREQRTTREIDSAKSQTHSATTVGFGFFTLNGSAVWPRHPRKLRAHRHQSGGMTPSKPPTRRRHAARGLHMAQNPHRSRLKCAASPTRPGTAPVGAKKLAQHRPSSSISAKEFTQHATKRRIWAILSALGELCRAHAHHQTKQGQLFRAHGATTRRH